LLATRRHRAPEEWAARVERDGHGTVEETLLTSDERAQEMLLMGLRLTEGIDPKRFAERTGQPLTEALDRSVLEQAQTEGYLEWRDGRLAATQEGRLRLDSLLAALIRD
jgi:oxygen-independent coproporphyrinogen-3 oxidase